MKQMFSKLLVATVASLLFLAGALPVSAEEWSPDGERPGDVVIGDPAAPVTIYEYASLTCPHCARFHTELLPGFKKGWIDTGKAKLVYRHFPLDKSALAGALAVSCLSPEKRADAITRLFKSVSSWAYEEDIAGALMQNLPEQQEPTQLITCMSAKASSEAVANVAIEASRGGVSGTPTFFVAGHKLEGTARVVELGRLVDDALADHLAR